MSSEKSKVKDKGQLNIKSIAKALEILQIGQDIRYHLPGESSVIAKVEISGDSGSIVITWDSGNALDNAIVDVFTNAISLGGGSCSSTGDGSATCS
jgi:hypothetical protein